MLAHNKTRPLPALSRRATANAADSAVLKGPMFRTYFSGCFLTLTASLLAAQSPQKVVTLPVVSSLDVRDFGAACNWNKASQEGKDDTRAFQAAARAATLIYNATDAPIEVRVPNGCKIAGSVVYGSGVHWKGPGSIIVPLQRPAPVLEAQNADDISVQDITVTVLDHATECSSASNDASCVAISYQTTSTDSRVAHRKIRFTGNTVYNSSWGILIENQAGNDTVSDVKIDHNSVISTKPYTYHDGIHLGGGVSLFTISNNEVYGRGDAAVAVSSEVNKQYLCSGGAITGNTMLENLVGLDDSGCSDLAVTGNYVKATTPVDNTSNPAFRSIYYNGNLPTGLNVSGNTFINYHGVNDDVDAKFDLLGSSTSNESNSTFVGNTIGALYTRGSRITVQGNTFLDGATWNCDVDASNGIPTDSIMFGQNAWLGMGTASCVGNPGLITNDYFSPQISVGKKLTVNVGSMITSMP